MLLADINLGEVFWSLLVIFFMVVWFMILFSILGDLFRDHELGGVAKTIWVIALVFLPFISMLIYLIVRGGGMAERAMKSNVEAQKQMNEYVSQMAANQGGGGGAADQIASAHALLEKGAISQAEFDAIKAKALSS
jgi:ABC-type multidrug transport system fused ATPase/permease subunit